ncbi:hypothetical protein GCM10010174_33680 [Kutzneria viridogrisea]|uniref:Uncharacterized protein n=2 Tax=Kutzneria TaxID=43356 RepID=W5WLK7_9PSEU|nr:hypothetical protein [Kutzneria albida]AHI02109.1 hypothetical protein KALB_8752 [Kutzneria albida DSM 43870]MBA8929330.1 ABC-type glucose/galactose transport system permease subunit [Kutzneria viridogrisea]
MTAPAPTVFRAFRRLALSVFWPCLLFTVVGLFMLQGAPVTPTPYGLGPLLAAVIAAVVVLRVVDRRQAPARKPDRKGVVDMARSMFFARLVAGELVLLSGLVLGWLARDLTPLVAGLACMLLLYTWLLRTDNFLGALRGLLDPVGAGQLTDAVVKRAR